MSLCGLGLSCEPLPCEHGKELRKEQCSLCELKTQIMALNDMYNELSIRVIAQHDFKLRQIDENRKISRRVEEISHWKNGLKKNIIFSENKPHKCPICDGNGCGKESYGISVDGVSVGVKNHPCHACEGKGILWG